LQHYGIRGITHNIFSSYLKERKQYVSVNDNNSLIVDIQYGVLQGSVLGLLLFLLYINDLSNCSSNQPILFADDTCLTLQEISSENLTIKIESEIHMFTQ